MQSSRLAAQGKEQEEKDKRAKIELEREGALARREADMTRRQLRQGHDHHVQLFSQLHVRARANTHTPHYTHCKLI